MALPGSWKDFENSSRPQKGAVEVWCLPAATPTGIWRRIFKRSFGFEVFAEHWQNSFVFWADDKGPAWRLVRAPIDDPSPSRWEEIVPTRASVTLEQIHVLEHHLVVLEREGIRPRLVVRDQNGQVQTTIMPDEGSCTLKVGVSAGGHYSGARHAFRGSELVYSVTSFVTPETVIAYDLENDRATSDQVQIPGYYAAQYVATVAMAKA
ncbi:protease II [Bradyrhizobium sp. GM6.1]